MGGSSRWGLSACAAHLRQLSLRTTEDLPHVRPARTNNMSAEVVVSADGDAPLLAALVHHTALKS